MGERKGAEYVVCNGRRGFHPNILHCKYHTLITSSLEQTHTVEQPQWVGQNHHSGWGRTITVGGAEHHSGWGRTNTVGGAEPAALSG